MGGVENALVGGFLADGLADALMLLLALRFFGCRARPARVAAGALLGAGIAVLCRKCLLTREQTAALWLPTAVLMMAVAGGRHFWRRPVRGVLLLLASAGLLGGVIQALYGATGSLMTAYGIGTAAAVIIALSALRAGQDVACVRRIWVSCLYRGCRAEFEAMVDSGNCLRDYLTHRPVIVLPERFGREQLCPQGQGLRPIFASTAGGRRMMWCFLPEETVVRIGAERRVVQAAAALAPDLEETALFPSALLEEFGK